MAASFNGFQPKLEVVAVLSRSNGREGGIVAGENEFLGPVFVIRINDFRTFVIIPVEAVDDLIGFIRHILEENMNPFISVIGFRFADLGETKLFAQSGIGIHPFVIDPGNFRGDAGVGNGVDRIVAGVAEKHGCGNSGCKNQNFTFHKNNLTV